MEWDNAENPFLMYVSFTVPHDPREAPEQYVKIFKPEYIKVPPDFLPRHPFANGEDLVRDESVVPFPRKQIYSQVDTAIYYSMITHVDHQIGNVIKVLEEKGQLDNTIIIFSSDNGMGGWVNMVCLVSFNLTEM